MNLCAAKTFEDTLAQHSLTMDRKPMEILQINVGKRCNQACSHCHVEAGPKRTETMERKTFDRLLELLDGCDTIHTVDITGGAPELNPHFRYFVSEAARRGLQIIDRCNLTILFEPGQEGLGEFLKDHKVQIVASMPCYSKENVDKQRGRGVFDKSIQALQALNKLGYGQENTGLVLSLVYNPGGAFLPPDQVKLEADYKRELDQLFGIQFNDLFTITNMPIKRFYHYLQSNGQLEDYMTLLIDHFNPSAANGVMCRNLVSVGWDGLLFDCDFNQMLNMGQAWKTRTIWDIASLASLEEDPIALADHCFGCTAGAGSSCGGALV